MSLHTDKETITTDNIKYLTGLLQGDCLSLLLFIISVNPLSFLLKQLPGYNSGPPGARENIISHLFFVDDLKTYAKNIDEAKIQADMITQFTNDIGMEFGTDKCAYLYIEKGRRKTLKTTIDINGLQLNELAEGDTYKYLGQDEAVGFNSPLNKEKVCKEYFRRVRKIWHSELYAKNKIIAHNIFAVPVLSPTFGILNWTKDELEQIDIKTRKLLTVNGSFHVNSDVDRLYTHRTLGGRGLNSAVDTYISRTISLTAHIKMTAPKHPYIKLVKEHENNNLLRVSNELMTAFQIDINENETPKVISSKIKKEMKRSHYNSWLGKIQHGYLFKQRHNIKELDESATNAWLKHSTVSSHVEGYICAIQEEEINTKLLNHKRKKEGTNPKCRVCHNQNESIQHIIACCPKLSASMYLPVRHNEVARVVYENLISKETKVRMKSIQEVYSDDEIELWWDTKLKTGYNVQHNKPDIVLWQKKKKKCFIIDIKVGLDTNIDKNINLTHDLYFLLSAELKRLYQDYTFEIVPIVLGATGAITKHLKTNLTKIGIENTNYVIRKCQMKSVLGTMKVVKSVMKL